MTDQSPFASPMPRVTLVNSFSRPLENAVATGAVLYVLILLFGPVSGAHFNPVVTGVDAVLGGLNRRDVGPYVLVQVLGACAGAILANLMFGLGAVTVAQHNAVAHPVAKNCALRVRKNHMRRLARVRIIRRRRHRPLIANGGEGRATHH